MNTIPEVGSKWLVGESILPETVSAVVKRGRGYQVRTQFEPGGGANFTYRLRDFLKAAKPL